MSHGNKSSHEDNRKKSVLHVEKNYIWKKRPESFLITKNTEKLIKQFISNVFDLTDEKYPLSICINLSYYST